MTTYVDRVLNKAERVSPRTKVCLAIAFALGYAFGLATVVILTALNWN